MVCLKILSSIHSIYCKSTSQWFMRKGHSYQERFLSILEEGTRLHGWGIILQLVCVTARVQALIPIQPLDVSHVSKSTARQSRKKDIQTRMCQKASQKIATDFRLESHCWGVKIQNRILFWNGRSTASTWLWRKPSSPPCRLWPIYDPVSIWHTKIQT